MPSPLGKNIRFFPGESSKIPHKELGKKNPNGPSFALANGYFNGKIEGGSAGRNLGDLSTKSLGQMEVGNGYRKRPVG
jgi:hypothetical protein